MFFKLRRTATLHWFNWSVRAVCETPAAEADVRSKVELVTQLHPPDLLMYLVAVKTFVAQVPVRRIRVVADRLTEKHRALLREHVHDIHIVDIGDIDTRGFPSGGTWERLLHIVDTATDAYVIQLDADTITRSETREVGDCIRSGRSFTLGTSMGREIIAAQEMARQLTHLSAADAHIQVHAELAFAGLGEPGARYVRGNSAFAGFAPGQHSRDRLRRFSDRMTELLGAQRWRQWGSEQVASNYCIANAPDSVVLPFERYRYFDAGADLSAAAFLHFIGTQRFAHGVYRRISLEAIRNLRARHALFTP